MALSLTGNADYISTSPFDGKLIGRSASAAHPKLAATATNVVNKPPSDGRSIQEQWNDLLRGIIEAGAIAIIPDDPPQAPLLGIANKPNRDGTQHWLPRIARTPELRGMSQATVLYVFGL
jgi:hypothetical protein